MAKVFPENIIWQPKDRIRTTSSTESNARKYDEFSPAASHVGSVLNMHGSCTILLPACPVPHELFRYVCVCVVEMDASTDDTWGWLCGLMNKRCANLFCHWPPAKCHAIKFVRNFASNPTNPESLLLLETGKKSNVRWKPWGTRCPPLSSALQPYPLSAPSGSWSSHLKQSWNSHFIVVGGIVKGRNEYLMFPIRPQEAKVKNQQMWRFKGKKYQVFKGRVGTKWMIRRQEITFASCY